jgi:hypothetical protein
MASQWLLISNTVHSSIYVLEVGLVVVGLKGPWVIFGFRGKGGIVLFCTWDYWMAVNTSGLNHTCSIIIPLHNPTQLQPHFCWLSLFFIGGRPAWPGPGGHLRMKAVEAFCFAVALSPIFSWIDGLPI